MTYVDTEPVRAHILALRAVGVGTRRVSAAAGVGRKAVQDVFRTRQMAAENAEAILAVPVQPQLPADRIEPHGVHRRVRALCALGWPLHAQAGIAGVHETQYRRATLRSSVEIRTWDRVVNVYDKLSMEVPSGRGSNWVKVAARRAGWFPPLAWDDETIDVADALPCLLPPVDPVDRDLEMLVQHLAAGHPVEPTTAAIREVIRRMPGARPAEIALIARRPAKVVANIRSHMKAAACR